ncbi:WYL domain-containing protein, partial [Anaerolineae bacterium CFX9]|nr:WYL domain-containing protein [Anaerolineae bacterium CFX9]
LGEPLSPHHMVVPTGRAEDLLAKLERRDCHVTSHLKPSTSPDDSALSPEVAEYLWLAVRVYQKLGAFVSQDIPIPGAAREWLTQQLPAGSIDSLEYESNLLIDRLAQAVRGHSPSLAIIQQEDSAAVRAAVQSAYEQRGALTVEYFSPARGEKTVRTIEPVMLYERNGAEYVEAWCRLDDDTRTFRLDRIVSVFANGENPGQHHPG